VQYLEENYLEENWWLFCLILR